MEFLSSPQFWIAVGQIILIDILLGGDNAVVIALACRKLPPKQRTQGILWGTAGAIVLRIVLIFFALTLLAIPFLKIVGALLLLWIGVKLLVPEHEDGHASIEGSDKLWGAVKTVIVADFVMSLDNVIAIAGAAEASGTGHSMALVIFGVLVSIPIIVWGSQLVIKLMDRYPIIITLGGMLLGWIAGTMMVTDPALIDPQVLPGLPKIEPSDLDALWRRRGRRPAGAGHRQVDRRARVPRRRRRRRLPRRCDRRRPGGCAACCWRWTAPKASMHATRQVIEMRQDLADPAALDLQLLHVQRPVSGDVSSFIASKTLDEYYQEQSEAALAPARAALDEAGVRYEVHSKVGNPAEHHRQDGRRSCGSDLIVMGTRGQGLASTMLGSVAQATVAESRVPVLLVK